MDWKDCNLNKFVKKIKPDENLIKSLILSSENKLKSGELLEINNITASSKLSLFYDSLREILEAISIKKRFKIYNHECFVGFLKEICNEDEFSKSFDKLRIVRNQINYYGKTFSVEDIDYLIDKTKELRLNLIKKYLK
jgi:hypothetical protein